MGVEPTMAARADAGLKARSFRPLRTRPRGFGIVGFSLHIGLAENGGMHRDRTCRHPIKSRSLHLCRKHPIHLTGGPDGYCPRFITLDRRAPRFSASGPMGSQTGLEPAYTRFTAESLVRFGIRLHTRMSSCRLERQFAASEATVLSSWTTRTRARRTTEAGRRAIHWPVLVAPAESETVFAMSKDA